MGRKSLKKIRQKEILKAFYAVAKQKGFENTSIAKVAAHMDINPSLIIHYFKTKQDLEVALIDYILERYLHIYKSNGNIDTEEKLLDLIDKLLSRKWNRLFDDGVFYSCYAHIYNNKEFKTKFKQLHDALRSSFKQSLLDAKYSDVIDVDNIDMLTETIFTLLEGADYYLGLVDNQDEYDQKVLYYKQHIIELLQIRVSLFT